MRAMFEELSPILEKSEAFCKVLEEAKVNGFTEQNHCAFWITLRNVLLPHPELYKRMDELLRRQALAHRADAAKQAVLEPPSAQELVWIPG